MKLRKLARLCPHDRMEEHEASAWPYFWRCPGGVFLPDDTLVTLRAELLNQWDYNHFEYCGRTWPHPEGDFCGWPQPEALKALDELLGEKP